MGNKRNTLKISKSLLMKWTWKLYRSEKVMTDEAFANCLKRSWSVIKVYTANDEFARLYAKYFDGLFNYIKIMKVANPMDAEELTNDAFVKINENYILFNSERGNEGSWLYHIANNSVIDFYRKNDKYNANVSMSEYVDDNGKETMQIADELTTEDVVERNETREMIVKIINTTLTAKQRLVAELHFLKDYSYEEVKEELQISMADVKATIRRTRIALQNAIAKTELVY